jgi:hypothetical protein
VRALGPPVKASQALDEQSRCGVHTQKNQRDRVIALAQAHPDWALAFGDEVWWSRVTQPTAHARQELEQPVRLVEQAVAPKIPIPKSWPAMACWCGSETKKSRSGCGLWRIVR